MPSLSRPPSSSAPRTVTPTAGLLYGAAAAHVPLQYPLCPQTRRPRSDQRLPPPCWTMWHLAAGLRTFTPPSPPTMSLPARVIWGFATASFPVRPGPRLRLRPQPNLWRVYTLTLISIVLSSSKAVDARNNISLNQQTPPRARLRSASFISGQRVAYARGKRAGQDRHETPDVRPVSAISLLHFSPSHVPLAASVILRRPRHPSSPHHGRRRSQNPYALTTHPMIGIRSHQ